MSNQIGKMYLFDMPAEILGVRTRGVVKVAIHDKDGNGVINGDDVVKIKGRGKIKELDAQEQARLFKNLGVTQLDEMRLGFAVKYFKHVSQVAKQVSSGKFETRGEISDALLPETESITAARQWYYKASNFGFANPLKLQKKVYAKAEKVIAARDKVRQRYKKLVGLYANNSGDYWIESSQLRRRMQRLGMSRELKLVNKQDQKAYARYEIKRHIPADTEKHLAKLGLIEMDPSGITMAEKMEHQAFLDSL